LGFLRFRLEGSFEGIDWGEGVEWNRDQFGARGQFKCALSNWRTPIRNSKSQVNLKNPKREKRKEAVRAGSLRIGALEFTWDLVFGSWDFE
jgi:hypothetical protein